MTGATPEQVGQYALNYVQTSGALRSGTAQLLLSRSVTSVDMQQLGWGCLNFASIEEPPLVLVILKGDIHPRVPGSIVGNNDEFGVNYVALVFDLWSDVAVPSSIITSSDGSGFRKALNDPNLPPTSNGDAPVVCPTAPPKTLHYGDVAPTAVLPPKSLNPNATPFSDIRTPTPLIPEPISTPQP